MADTMRDGLLGLVITCVVLLVAAGIAYWVYTAVVEPAIHAPQRRETLHHFACQVQPGYPKSGVRELYQTSFSSSDIVFREHEPDCWVFELPREFRKTNWVLLVLFEGDEVGGIGVRTASSLKNMPADAPPDRVRSGTKQRWQARYGPE